MSTYVQFSDFAPDGFYPDVAAELRRVVLHPERIAFVASQPDQYGKNDEYSRRIFRWFHELGLNFSDYAIIDDRMSGGEQRKAIQNAPCVFLMGGKTVRQLEFLKEQGLIPLIQNHDGVIIGLSAGAINMSARSVIANSLCPPVSIHRGMGLVSTTVVPHFDHVTEEMIRSDLLPLTREGPLYGLCDDAVLVTANREIRLGGTVYLLAEGSIRKLT